MKIAIGTGLCTERNVNIKACHLGSKFVICSCFMRGFLIFLILFATHASVVFSQVSDKHVDTVLVRLHSNQNNAAYRKRLEVKEQKKGYLLAHADSIHPEEVRLVRGVAFDSIRVIWSTDTGDFEETLSVAGLNQKSQSYLSNRENHGYPFAAVAYTLVAQQENSAKATIRAIRSTGQFFNLDTVIFENFEIGPQVLQWFSGIKFGQAFQLTAVERMENRLSTLEGFQSKGALKYTVVNGKLQVISTARKTTQDFISGFVGLATNPTGRPVFTGEAKGNFYNLLRTGASASFEWRSFKARSQELKMTGSLPYLFGAPFILKYRFEFQKYDTIYSTFIRGIQLRLPTGKNMALLLGLSYTDRLQIFTDVNFVKQFRRLPSNPASKNSNYSLGWEYSNIAKGALPMQGMAFSVLGSAGVRKILKDPQLESITWANYMGVQENVYDSMSRIGKINVSQYRLELVADKYVQLSPWTVLKLSFLGMRYHAPTVYFNELERYGGIKNMRGFNEQSIFANEFYMGTVELRLVLNQSGYVGPFYHWGWYSDQSKLPTVSNGPLQGAGIQVGLRTAAGVLHLAWAVGKSSSQSFGLNQSKFHVGLSNTF